MEVDFNSWHARLYRFHHKMKYGWESTYYYGTNLCPYMRTVLFYWWLRWLFINGSIGYKKVRINTNIALALVVFFFGPGWLGMFSYHLKYVLLVMDFIAAIVVAVIAFIFAFRIVNRKIRMFRAIGQTTEDVVEAAADATFGFFRLLGSYFDSFHDKICPHIDFVDNSTKPENPIPDPAAASLPNESEG